MKKILLFLVCCLGLLNANFAQPIATYTGTGGTSTATVATVPNETVGSLLNVGFGANTPCSSGGLSGITVSTAWTVYSASGPHVYFQILPNAGYTLNVTNFWAVTRESNTGPTLARLAYSLDGGVTWVDDGFDDPQSRCSCCGSYLNYMYWGTTTGPGAGPVLSGITATNGIIVAIFPYAPTGSTGTFQVQYMEVDGSVNIGSTPPTITTNPVNATICAGTNTSFTAAATGTPTPTYQWQRSTTGIGGPWINITTGMDGGIYGASFTTPTLTITGATIVDNGYAYQMVATNAGGSATSTPALLTVLTTPVVAAITGTTTLCSTGTTPLADATAGGVWSSSNTAVATVNTTGVVSGVAAGTSVISYTVTNTCGTTTVTTNVTVSSPAGAITGTTPICSGATTLFTDPTAGGTWSSSNPAIASVGATSGVVSGLSHGTATITYSVTNACGTTTATKLITIDTVAAPITGSSNLCIGATTLLSTTISGGTWTSSNTAVATVNPATGLVSGIASGTATISYTLTNSCGTSIRTFVVTISAAAGVISGTTTICSGSTTLLTDPTPGGTWSSSNPSIASVGALTGVVSGLAHGTATITYSVTNACGTTTATVPFTVDTFAGAITGSMNLCIGATSPLSTTVAGGTWTSSNTAVATIISSTGLITGVSAGTTIISYTLTNSCGTSTTTTNVTVFAAAAAISGSSSLCVGNTATYNNITAGGNWISSNTAVATIGATSGLLTALTQGTTTLSYIVTNPCGTTVATQVVTVYRNVAAISGTDTLCVGATSLFTDSTVGGTWNTVTGNAAISATGTLTGLAQGMDTVVFTVTNVCGTSTVRKPVYINSLPNAGTIIGLNNLCQGLTTGMSESIPGGIWSMSNSLATISAGGLVSGIAPGLDTVLYSTTNSCGTNSATMTIEILMSVTPAVSITASPGLSLCPEQFATFTPSTVNGGTTPVFNWSVNGIYMSTGYTFTYMPNNTDVVKCELISNATCASPDSVGTTVTMNVSAPVIPTLNISSAGGTTLCEGQSNLFSTTITNGGPTPTYQWSVNWVNVGTGSSYNYTPSNGDIVKCSLTSNAACAVPDTATATVIITTLPYKTTSVVLTAVPGNEICEGNPVLLNATVYNGGLSPVLSWYKNGMPITATNSYSYTPATGDVIKCVEVSNYKCLTPSDSSVATVTLSINPIILVTITGSPGQLVTEGANDTLYANVLNGGINPSYQWKVNGVPVPGAIYQRFIRNDLRDKDSVSCTVTTGSGTPCEGIQGFNWMIMQVGKLGVDQTLANNDNFRIYPNPNSGLLNIEGMVGNEDRNVTIQVTNVVGQIICTKSVPVYGTTLKTQLNLDDVANGVYTLQVITSTANCVRRFTVSR